MLTQEHGNAGEALKEGSVAYVCGWIDVGFNPCHWTAQRSCGKAYKHQSSHNRKMNAGSHGTVYANFAANRIIANH